jgi:hypothetical protein
VFSTPGLRAQGNFCAEISIGDVVPIVGSAPMKPVSNGCSRNAGSDHFVKIAENTSQASDVVSVLGLSRTATVKNHTVTEESGLGDKAFLSRSKNGVAALHIMKNRRLLQVQVWDGSQPSSATLSLLHAVAAQAIAVF